MRITGIITFVLLILAIPIQTNAADFTVNDATSLIAAINTANTNGEADTITLSADITLTVADNTTNGENGLPVILADGGNSLTIDGAGFTINRDTTAPNFRIMYVDAGATVTLQNLTIADGLATGGGEAPNGGGIYNNGTLTLNNSRAIRNTATERGGAIYNLDTLSLLQQTTIGGDSATDGNTAQSSGGGGIFSGDNSSVTIDASFIYGNSTDGQGGGLFVDPGSTTIIRNGSRIGGAGNLGNTAGSNSGGGVALRGTVTISNSTFEGNNSGSTLAWFGGGGLAIFEADATLDNVTIIGNMATNNDGGGLLVSNTNLTLRDSTITGNNALNNADAMTINLQVDQNDFANDLPSNYTINIERTEFDTDNSDTIRINLNEPLISTGNGDAGDINATINITDSTFSSRSGNGSGITTVTFGSPFTMPVPGLTFERSLNLNITNSTFANFSGAAFRDNIQSTSALLDGSDLDFNFNNVTMSQVGTGIQLTGETSGTGTRTVDVNVSNSFIEGTSLGANDCINTSSGNPITFAGNNNLSTGTNCSTVTGLGVTNTTSALLNLSALANNGGQTRTIALNTGSNAIDATGANATTNDQRGALANGTRDVGAFETNSTVPTVSYTVSETTINETTGATSATVDVTVAGHAGQPIDTSFTFSGSASTSDYSIIGSSDLTFNTDSTQRFTIQAVDDTLFEPDELINLEIFINGNATLTSSPTSSITIAESDAPEISYTVSDTTIDEATGTTSTTIDVTLVNYAGTPNEVSFAFTGTADTADYTIIGSSNLTFTANGTQSFTIQAVDDSLVEPDEQLDLELQLVSGNATITGSATNSITITSDDLDPVTNNGQNTNTGTNGTSVNPDINVFDPAISKLGILLPGQTGLLGEELEWIVTVSNVSTVEGTNVVVTDTLIDNLQIDSVEAIGATTNINGQTVTVTYPTLSVGETVTFSIFTTVIDGNTITNTACVASDTTPEECTSAIAPTQVTQLPATGETPLWRLWLMGLISIIGLMGAITIGIRNYRQTI